MDIRRKLYICSTQHCYYSLKSCCELMVHPNGSLIFIQYRHKQWVECIHKISISSTSSPKFIATQSIFLLLFHLTQPPASFMSTLLLLIFSIDGSWNTSALIPMCFPIISPFTVMGHDSIICRAYSSSVRNIKSSHLFRSM